MVVLATWGVHVPAVIEGYLIQSVLSSLLVDRKMGLVSRATEREGCFGKLPQIKVENHVQHNMYRVRSNYRVRTTQILVSVLVFGGRTFGWFSEGNEGTLHICSLLQDGLEADCSKPFIPHLSTKDPGGPTPR
jgi:hypothetical protein